jgi:hypothetical protein
LTHPARHGDFMGLAVTSVSTQEFAIGINDQSPADGRLPRPSWQSACTARGVFP